MPDGRPSAGRPRAAASRPRTYAAELARTGPAAARSAAPSQPSNQASASGSGPSRQGVSPDLHGDPAPTERSHRDVGGVRPGQRPPADRTALVSVERGGHRGVQRVRRIEPDRADHGQREQRRAAPAQAATSPLDLGRGEHVQQRGAGDQRGAGEVGGGEPGQVADPGLARRRRGGSARAASASRLGVPVVQHPVLRRRAAGAPASGPSSRCRCPGRGPPAAAGSAGSRSTSSAAAGGRVGRLAQREPVGERRSCRPPARRDTIRAVIVPAGQRRAAGPGRRGAAGSRRSASASQRRSAPASAAASGGDQQPGHAAVRGVAERARHPADRGRQHRHPAGQRLGHHHPVRLPAGRQHQQVGRRRTRRPASAPGQRPGEPHPGGRARPVGRGAAGHEAGSRSASRRTRSVQARSASLASASTSTSWPLCGATAATQSSAAGRRRRGSGAGSTPGVATCTAGSSGAGSTGGPGSSRWW